MSSNKALKLTKPVKSGASQLSASVRRTGCREALRGHGAPEKDLVLPDA